VTKLLAEVRRRVSVAGFITDAHTGRAIYGALVRLERDDMRERQTRSAPDGLYYFLDLRTGAWNMSVTLPSMGVRYREVNREVIVESPDQDPPFVNIALEPFVIRGKVSEKGENGIAMAEVMVKGSGEKCFSDTGGRYAIVAVEPVKPGHSRTVQVFAQGFKAASRPAEMDAAMRAFKPLDFELERAVSRPLAKKGKGAGDG
jgi:hypothetical protein